MQTSPEILAITLVWIAVGTVIALHMHEQCSKVPGKEVTFALALLLGLTFGPIMYVLALVRVIWVVYIKGQEIK